MNRLNDDAQKLFQVLLNKSSEPETIRIGFHLIGHGFIYNLKKTFGLLTTEDRRPIMYRVIVVKIKGEKNLPEFLTEFQREEVAIIDKKTAKKLCSKLKSDDLNVIISPAFH